MANTARADIKYPDLFAAVGKFIADKEMSDVCVMEYEDGVIVTGSVMYEGRAGFYRKLETHVLPTSDLRAMISGKRLTPGR